MDADRFEMLLRTLHATPTRRLTLRTLAVLSLSTLLGQQDGEAKKKGKGKKGKNKKKGKKCVPDCSGKSCGDDGCGGSCGSCPVDKICDGVSCVCPPGQLDSGGVCATEPICAGANTLCGANGQCCSAFCAGLLLCASSEAGQPCHVTNDCQPGLTCVGFVCTA